MSAVRIRFHQVIKVPIDLKVSFQVKPSKTKKEDSALSSRIS